MVTALFGLTACSPATDEFDVSEEEQDFHLAFSEEDTEKVPYTLTGENEDWKISFQVREATNSEKELMLQSLDEQLRIYEENYTVHHIMTEEQYNGFCERTELKRSDISENAVYISIMMGQYVGDQNIQTTEKTLFYKIMSKENKVLAFGGRDINSLSSPWYLATNTVKGDWCTTPFVPPLEGCKVILQYDDIEIEIPLTLKVGENG